jgi:hypothetical protein
VPRLTSTTKRSDVTHRMAELIPLEPSFLSDSDPAEVNRRIERIVRSTKFEVVRDERAFRILGPAVPYHAIDPFLADGLTHLRKDLRIEHAQSYHTQTAAFYLCLEDSWSGYFVAEWLRTSPTAGDIVFIHLDHHTDMMPSLLERHVHCLVDPTDGRAFDARSSADWQKGIESGSIGIGSFVTTLFYLPNRLHVRHINNYLTSDYTSYSVTRSTRSHLEIPNRTFAAIRKTRGHPSDVVGTYRGGRDPVKVLAAIPPGRIVVHIDLDYLINDFDGNPCDRGWSPAPNARELASRKLDAFFDALLAIPLHVDRWIVATSPGFCSACHWAWLLESIERGIERIALACGSASPTGMHGSP